MLKQVQLFIDDESGATALEYCMIGSIISIVILAAIKSMTASLELRYTAIAAAVN